MTPLGCPDCLLIRYEPRALRARARASAPSHSRFLAKLDGVARFFCRYFFLGLSFFLECPNVYESRVFRSFAPCQIDGGRL